MDINSRINWMPGMELTTQTFKGLDENLDFRQQIAVRAALGGNQLGLLPGAEFSCKSTFVKNTLEIERFKCTAILASGRILSVDEQVAVPIPMLYGSEYYLTVSFGEGIWKYEREGVSYVRPQYAYAFHVLDELPNEDCFPVARFRVSEGVLSYDDMFIPPCLLLSADGRFEEYGARFIQKLEALSEHGSLEEGEGKRAILRYLFYLKGYQWDNNVRDFIRLTQEIAQAIDYYIMTPHSEKPVKMYVFSQYDVQKWLQWFDEYLTGATAILDTVVLEDKTIDYEALLAQAKAELYERLNPELYERLLNNIKDELREELYQKLYDTMRDYISDSVRPDLFGSLDAELDSKLYEKLYMELFEHLFNALFVPEVQEKDFFPSI